MMTSFPYPEVDFAWNASAWGTGAHNVTAVAYDMAGNSNSTSVYVTVPSVPNAPLQLQAIGHDKSVTLSWETPAANGGSPVMNYTVYRGTAIGAEVYAATLDNVTAWNDTGLTNGQKYFYTVAAANIAGNGPLSNEANATPSTPGTMPGYAPGWIAGMLGLTLACTLVTCKRKAIELS
jgi:hypothetical protein